MGTIDKIVITGCGRSGTTFVANALTSAGYRCTHERAATERGWKGFEADSQGDASWFAAAYLSAIPDDITLVHLVRNPISVAKSFYRIGLFARSALRTTFQNPVNPRHVLGLARRPAKLIARFQYVKDQRCLVDSVTSVFDLTNEFERCLRYWYEWNCLVEDHLELSGRPRIRLRLEDLDTPLGWDELSMQLGMNIGPPFDVPRNKKAAYPPRQMPQHTIDGRILNLSKSYGYTGLETNISG